MRQRQPSGACPDEMQLQFSGELVSPSTVVAYLRAGNDASEPEDSSHVQLSDGDGASEPETTNVSAVQRADGDIV